MTAASQENQSSRCLTRFDTNPAGLPQKTDRSLKFWISEVDGLNYLCHGGEARDLKLEIPGTPPTVGYVFL